MFSIVHYSSDCSNMKELVPMICHFIFETSRAVITVTYVTYVVDRGHDERP